MNVPLAAGINAALIDESGAVLAFVMITPNTRRRCLSAFALGLLGAQRWARAQTPAFPSRPITVVVPSQPGGGFDLIGRAIAEGLGRQFGTGAIVENRTGSGTLVGTQSVAAAAADGYTLLVGGLSNLAFNAALYKNPRYDALTDFATIGLVGAYPYVLVVRADLPVNNYSALFHWKATRPIDTSRPSTTGGLPSSSRRALRRTDANSRVGGRTADRWLPSAGTHTKYPDSRHQKLLARTVFGACTSAAKGTFFETTLFRCARGAFAPARAPNPA